MFTLLSQLRSVWCGVRICSRHSSFTVTSESRPLTEQLQPLSGLPPPSTARTRRPARGFDRPSTARSSSTKHGRPGAAGHEPKTGHDSQSRPETAQEPPKSNHRLSSSLLSPRPPWFSPSRSTKRPVPPRRILPNERAIRLDAATNRGTSPRCAGPTRCPSGLRLLAGLILARIIHLQPRPGLELS